MHMKSMKQSLRVEGIKELILLTSILQFSPQIMWLKSVTMETGDLGCDWICVRLAEECASVMYRYMCVCVCVFTVLYIAKKLDWCCCCLIETLCMQVSGPAWLPTILFVNVNVTFSNCFSFAAIITALLITWIFQSQAHYGHSIFPSFSGMRCVTLSFSLIHTHRHTHTHTH